jgi:DNA-binding GntR family transcriptional regulator
VARRYRASRLPVRQALLRLEMEGLVTFTSHVGARVTTLTLADLDELYRLRERLEPLAVAESTPLLSGDQLAEIAALDREMREVGAADRRRWIGLDRRFHMLTYAAAPLPRLRATIAELWNVVQPYRPAYTALPDTLDAAQREHRELIEAIRRRDHEVAAEIVEGHVRRTRVEVLPTLEAS